MVEQGAKRKNGRALRWVFGASVALNLVFVGLFAGAAFRHAGHDDRSGPDRGARVVRGYAAPYVQALPKEARRALGRELHENRVAKDLDGEGKRAFYDDMMKALRAEPFDAQKVQDVLKSQENALMSLQSEAQGLWLIQITLMSDGERAAYTDRLEEALVRRDRRRKNKDGKPPRD